MGDQFKKKKFDTTKMSPEELKRLDLDGARKPPGQHPGVFLHQQGGSDWTKAKAFGVTVAATAALVAAGLLAYDRYLTAKNERPGQPKEALERRHPAASTDG